MHAMAKYTTTVVFPAYLPTLNPYLFLRDLFGAMVIVGLVIAIGRRFGRKGRMAPTTPDDVYAIAITAMIILSGVLLEGTKISSYSAYQEMVESYAGGESEARAPGPGSLLGERLRGRVSHMKGPFDAEMLAQEAVSIESPAANVMHRPTGVFWVTAWPGPWDRWLWRLTE